MKGAPRELAETLIEQYGDNLDYAVLKSSLEASFGVRLTMGHYRQQFHRMQWDRNNELIDDFVRRLRTLVAKGWPHDPTSWDDTVKEQILYSLPDDCKYMAAMYEDKDLDSVIRWLRTATANEYLEATLEQTSVQNMQQSTQYDQRWQERQERNLTQYDQRQGNREGQQDRGRRDISHITCHLCNQKGHYQRNCPEKSSAKRQGSAQVVNDGDTAEGASLSVGNKGTMDSSVAATNPSEKEKWEQCVEQQTGVHVLRAAAYRLPREQWWEVHPCRRL